MCSSVVSLLHVEKMYMYRPSLNLICTNPTAYSLITAILNVFHVVYLFDSYQATAMPQNWGLVVDYTSTFVWLHVCLGCVTDCTCSLTAGARIFDVVVTGGLLQYSVSCAADAQVSRHAHDENHWQLRDAAHPQLGTSGAQQNAR